MQRFVRRVAEAAAGTGEAREALAFMGIQLKDANGNIRPSAELLEDVAEGLKKVESPANRLRIAVKLFDSEGGQMVNMLSEGKGQLHEAGAELERLGLITNDQAARAEDYADALTAMNRAISFLGHTLGVVFLPKVQATIERMTEFFIAIRPAALVEFQKAVDNISAAIDWLQGVWGRLSDSAGGFMDMLTSNFPIVGQWIDQFLGLADEVGWLTTLVGVLVGAMGIKLVGAVVAVVGSIGKLGALLLANPLTLAITAIGGAAYLLYKHWDEIVLFFEQTWEKTIALFDAGGRQGIWNTGRDLEFCFQFVPMGDRSVPGWVGYPGRPV